MAAAPLTRESALFPRSGRGDRSRVLRSLRLFTSFICARMTSLEASAAPNVLDKATIDYLITNGLVSGSCFESAVV